jgi:hypothetical protein
LIIVCLLLSFGVTRADYNVLLKKMKAAGGESFYCGKPPGRQVKAHSQPRATDIKHVVMVTRHGDRTSWGWFHDSTAPLGTLSCYPGDTNAWNDSCAYAQEFPGRSLRSLTTNAPWLSRRVYRHNVQAGQCLQGMLTKNGAEQHRINGRRVYNDYVKGHAHT